MDERVETFMRDVASDIGKSPEVVSENTRRLTAEFVQTTRVLAGDQADARERPAWLSLEKRVNEELQRYRQTATEKHLLIVLQTLRKERLQKYPSRFIRG